MLKRISRVWIMLSISNQGIQTFMIFISNSLSTQELSGWTRWLATPNVEISTLCVDALRRQNLKSDPFETTRLPLFYWEKRDSKWVGRDNAYSFMDSL